MHGRLRAGQRVLVHGAAGAVGSMATQLARGVVATSSAPDAPTIRRCSTSARMSSSTSRTRFSKWSAEPTGVRCHRRRHREAVRRPDSSRRNPGVDFVVESDRAQLTEIVRRVRDGRLRTNIGNVSTLERCRRRPHPTKRIKGKPIIRVRPQATRAHRRTQPAGVV
jgi:NADPH:quinone reductase-like Zn-dependent oxidoreductase